MSECIEVEVINAPTEKDFYVIMCRFGDDFWGPLVSYEDYDSAFKYANRTQSDYPWKIIRVRLPIEINGEQAIKSPN